MNRRTSLYVVAAAVVPFAVAVTIALATPPSGVTPVAHVGAAKLAKGVKVNADGIKFQTKRRTDVSVLTLKLKPGGTTGWHGHPGFAVIAVTKGTGTLYAADCSSKRFRAGQAFVEDGNDPPTLFRNETSDPVVVTVSFIAPRDAAIIRDEADPGCGVS
jgi:quercetin dioxygenase-like cupin family protein